MSDEPKGAPQPDYTSVGAYLGAAPGGATARRATVDTIPWDQPATMIDLEGRVPILGTIRDCAMHYALYKPHARDNARLVLTQPVHRPGRATRTWLLEPSEIAALAERLQAEG